MKHPHTTVVFDLDGTLVDTGEDLAYSVNHMRHLRGLSDLDTPSVLRAVGRGAGYLIEKTLEISPVDPKRQNELLEAYRAHYLEHQGERSKPYPGIEDALLKLGRIAKLYVLSNKPEDATRRELEICGLARYFQKIWGGGSFEKLKPDPTGIEAAWTHANSDPAHTVMVGDLFVDMETAARADVSSIFVTWGFGVKEDLRHTPTRIATGPSDLPRIVNELFAGKSALSRA